MAPMHQAPAPTSQASELQTLWDVVEAQVAIMTEAKRATEQAKTEIDRLTSELRQSSDKEADI